jgi:hypothetical protein
MDPNAVSSQGELVIATLVLVFYFAVLIAMYILSALAYYKLFKKARVPHAWLAWIPIGYMWPFMWTIKKSAWNLLWLLVPIANIVFYIIWIVKFYKAFGMSPHWLWLMLIPGLGSFILFIQILYMGFSRHVQYRLGSYGVSV